MGSRMRILVIIGGAAAALFAAAAILLAVLVDPNKYTGEAASLVKAKTGRDLVFDGAVRLTFFPRLGVATGGVRLGNPPGFGDKPFTRVSRAEVSIKVLPLLLGRVEVGRVRLEGLEMRLERDAEGRASWADLLGPEEPAQDAAKDAAKPDTGPSLLSRLSMDGLSVADATLVLENRQTGAAYAVSDLDVEVKAIHAGRPAAFKASCELASRRPELTARLEVSGTATLNAGDDRHVFTDLALRATAAGKAVPGGKAEFSLGLADLKIDFSQQTAQGGGLTFSAYGARGTGQFQAANLRQGPDVKGRLDIADFNGRELSAALTGRAPADAAAYQHITASLEFKSGKGYLEIPDLRASLDDARVEGRLRVTGAEKKAYAFDLRVSGLDADRFLPARKREAANGAGGGAVNGEVKAAGEGGERKAGLFPVQTLRDTQIDGQISAERLTFRGLRFASLKLPVMCRGGVLDIGPVDARLYDGTLRASTRLDVRGEHPALSQSLVLAGVQAKPLFSDLKGKESGFAGVMHVETLTPLVCQGDGEHALKRSLSGRVRFHVRDGVFPGVNLGGMVADARAKNSAAGHTGAEKSTKFGSLDGTAVIQNGVAAINDLEFKAPFLRAEGRGAVDIATKQVDYTIRAKLVASTEGQGGGSARGALGIPVPIHVTGPYDDLSYSTDYLRALGQGAVEAVGGVVQGIGEVITGKKSNGRKSSGGLLDSVKKLF